MERASWFQFGLVGADASGGGLMERASCNSFPHWLPWCFTRGFMEWGIHRKLQLSCLMKGLMECALYFQFGWVGAVASGGGLMKRASCNSPRPVSS